MQSICFLYSGAPTYAARHNLVDAVLRNDEFIITCHAAAEIKHAWDTGAQTEIEKRSYRYIDFWGAGYFTQADVAAYGVATWAPGPGDAYSNAKMIRASKGPYPYRIDRFHKQRFLKWAQNIRHAFPDSRGLFLDDWTPTPRWWQLSPEQQAHVWPWGWHTPLGFDRWARGQMGQIERGLYALSKVGGRDIICNGDARTVAPRCFEGVGLWHSINKVEREAKAGDILLVKGINADRETWAKTPLQQDYKSIWKQALSLAYRKDLRVALALAAKPSANESKQNVHKWTDPNMWREL